MRPIYMIASLGVLLLTLSACNIPPSQVHPPIQPNANQGGGQTYLRDQKALGP